MRRTIRYAGFAGLLLLLASLAGADPINTIAGSAGLDLSSPRVWRHGTAVSTDLDAGSIAPSATQYMPMVGAVLAACNTTAACGGAIETLLMLDPSLDATPTTNNALYTFGALQVFNGTTWDRFRSASSTTFNDAGLGLPAAGLYHRGSAVTWDRSEGAYGDGMAAKGKPAAGMMVLRTGTALWDRLQSAGDNITSGGGAGAIVAVNTQLLDGSSYDVARAASTTSLTATTSVGVSLTVPNSTWSATHTPATATQATASRAAGAAGVRHVATTLTACIASGITVQTPVLINLRDGATGAGAVLWSGAVSAPANDSNCTIISGLAMIGTAATAMTLEFAAAGAAATQETVTLTGFSVVP